MRVFTCTYRRNHFRSRHKDGGHTIQSSITENVMLHANVVAFLLKNRNYCRSKFYFAGIEIFRNFFFCDLDPWPSYRNFTRISSWCTEWPKMYFLCQCTAFESCLLHIPPKTLPRRLAGELLLVIQCIYTNQSINQHKFISIKVTQNQWMKNKTIWC